MRVLDLFSGMGGWSQAFLDRGHTVYRVDNDIRFADVPRTMVSDVLTANESSVILFPGESAFPLMNIAWDVVLASPPCQAFSLAATGTHMWAVRNCVCGRVVTKRGEKWDTCSFCKSDGRGSATMLVPRTDFGRRSVQLVKHTLNIIDNIARPKFWWMENPNGGMIHFVPDSIPRVQVTYCQYGEDRMKLTNLWGNWPDTWVPRPRCVNGAPCHVAAPRSSKTGTQGIKGAALRAIVPYELSMEVCLAAEAAL